MRLIFLAALLAFTAIASGEPPFHVYAPNPGSKQLWVIAAKPSPTGIELAVESIDSIRASSLSDLDEGKIKKRS